jgi:membrane protease YdiL (CAAX protease family)
VFIQIFEQAGWTGFMQDTIQERRGLLLASILVAPAFILMHLPPSSWTRMSDWPF